MTVQEWLGSDNKLGIDIWTNKYQFENETFDEWLDRVSNGNEEVKRLILEKKFLFGGRILSNRGLDKKGVKTTLSNCYVIAPPEDNIESIFECATKLARTYSYGGGCGIDISKLAPRGAKVRNTAKETSGSVSFMDLYSLVTGLIGQNGRRGALMISLACDHPDIEEFIEIKSDLERVTKANISIRITDKFMYAVENDEDFVLSFTREETNDTITKTINARNLFHKICEMNWDYAEPGMLFWDRIENWNLLSDDDNFHYAGTNPCAEEPLPAGGSCLLGSLNLAEFIDEKNFDFDFHAFREAVEIAVKALNEVLDEGMSLHPLAEQRESVRDWRQIGLGIFGLADMLIKLNIRYGSKKSIELCNEIGFTMANTAIETSAYLASVHGVYPKYNSGAVENSNFLRYNASQFAIGNVVAYGLHNSQLLTIAPTGSLSSMLGVSGGIEPIFANYYTRKTESLHGHDEYYKVYTPIVEKYMKEHNITDDSMLPDFFVTAQDLDYKNRIEMQAVWQKHIDASISSTVNVPNSFTVEETEDLYMSAWKSGLKGVTIFRDGCKRTGILTTSNNKTDDGNEAHELKRGEIIATDDNIIGLKRKLMTGCGSLHCQAFFDQNNGELREIYLSKGSTGGCNNFMIGLSRMISAAARAGVSLDDIVDQLMSTGACPSYAKRGKSKGSCCPMAIGYALKDMHKQFNEYFMGNTIVTEVPKKAKESEPHIEKNSKILCPNCGEELVFEGGCNSCKACGWSKCDL
jgi:ribonucleoside-diphosphate reductase alpha chain